MTDNDKHPMLSGFRILWRRQAVLWWIFAVNLVCGLLGAVPGALRAHRALLHSFAGEPLTNRFDLGMFLGLVRLHEVSIMRYTTTSYLFAAVFVVFMLFVMGGVLESYRQDQRPTTRDFFAASGAYFWRFVRLLLLSIVPFVIVGIVYQLLNSAADHVGDRAIADQVGIFMGWGATLVALLLALFVRLWFDIAQVRTVAQNERRMWRNVWRSWRITWHQLGRLYWLYLRIAVLGWIVFLVLALIWTKLPATASGLVFLLLELLVFTQVTARLWQLASATAWYSAHAEMQPATIAPVVVDAPPEALEAPASPEAPAPVPTEEQIADAPATEVMPNVTETHPAAPDPELPPRDT